MHIANGPARIVSPSGVTVLTITDEVVTASGGKLGPFVHRDLDCRTISQPTDQQKRKR